MPSNPTPITLSFAPLTDTVVAFATVAAWNAYFANVTVTIAGENLPTPTADELGAILLVSNQAATATTWTAQSYGADYYVPITAVDAGGVQYTANLVTKDSFDKLKANVDQLKALYDALVAALKTAGAMSDV